MGGIGVGALQPDQLWNDADASADPFYGGLLIRLYCNDIHDERSLPHQPLAIEVLPLGAEPVASSEAESLSKILPQDLFDDQLLTWLSKYRTTAGLSRQTVLAAFAEVGLSEDSLGGLVDCVVLDGQGRVTYESFVAVVMAVAGEPRAQWGAS